MAQTTVFYIASVGNKFGVSFHSRRQRKVFSHRSGGVVRTLYAVTIFPHGARLSVRKSLYDDFTKTATSFSNFRRLPFVSCTLRG